MKNSLSRFRKFTLLSILTNWKNWTLGAINWLLRMILEPRLYSSAFASKPRYGTSVHDESYVTSASVAAEQNGGCVGASRWMCRSSGFGLVDAASEQPPARAAPEQPSAWTAHRCDRGNPQLPVLWRDQPSARGKDARGTAPAAWTFSSNEQLVLLDKFKYWEQLHAINAHPYAQSLFL